MTEHEDNANEEGQPTEHLNDTAAILGSNDPNPSRTDAAADHGVSDPSDGIRPEDHTQPIPRQEQGTSTKYEELGDRPPSAKSGYSQRKVRDSNSRGRYGRVLLGAGAIAAVVGGAAGFGGYKLAQSTTPVTTALTAPTAVPQNTSVITSGNGTTNIQAVLAKVEPAIVDISTTGYQSNGFFGGSSAFQAAGTGMIMTSNGLVLTNAHVIANANSIKVTLLGQTKSYNAKVIGANTTHDVAVIQIEGASNLPTVTFGKSSALQVGDSVVAVGNALALQGLPTVTQGIVSGLHRSLSTANSTLNDLIQTDAPINPGNSGGPLVNSSGQVIGMNTAIIASTGTEPAQNIGFAEAIDSVLPVAQQIEAHPNPNTTSSGSLSSKPYLGVAVQNMNSALANQLGLPANTTGALVDQVVPGSPANNAGITPGSVIEKVGSTTIDSDTALVNAIQSRKAGDSVTIAWVNSSGQYSASLTLASAPTA